MNVKQDENRFALTKPAYSVNEILAMMPFGRTLLYAAIKSGKLIATKLGRKTIFLAPHVADFLLALPTIQGGK